MWLGEPGSLFELPSVGTFLCTLLVYTSCSNRYFCAVYTLGVSGTCWHRAMMGTGGTVCAGSERAGQPGSGRGDSTAKCAHADAGERASENILKGASVCDISHSCLSEHTRTDVTYPTGRGVCV